MLNKLFARPLELTIGDQVLKFNSTADFSFSMAGRSAVPSKKITDMVKFSTENLKQEARTIKDIEKRFVHILSQSIEDPGSINQAISQLDPLIFSQDHDWRDIIKALSHSDDTYDPFRRIALVKYMQYLSSRQEIIKYIYSEKKKMLKDTSAEELQDVPNFKDTLILDGAVFESDAGDESKEAPFEKMPKGEKVIVNLPPGSEMEILVSKHKCKIVFGDKLEFIDPDDHSFTLSDERNLIGRDSTSTVALDPSLRDVSRLHLIIENFGDNSLQLMDMSAHGTFIQAKWLKHYSAW